MGVTHYWDLITKHFNQYNSVSYINDHIGEAASENNKAMNWIMLVLNEDNLLYYCMFSILKNGSFLGHYNEDSSYFHQHKDQMLKISRDVYSCSLVINSNMNSKY
mmetsp:Transcript_23041/g.16377  ORF Transcript_23041/g.16377 Transcript_23041/m.16377 type:complete len:105 (+) Transcript_23041:456-770(+)